MDVQFMRFVELFGIPVTSANLKTYMGLYADFKVFPAQNLADSLERRFMLWGQNNHHDTKTAAESLRANCGNNENTHQMITNNNHLPHALQQIADAATTTTTTTVQTSPFNNFTLKPTTLETTTENTEVNYEMADQVIDSLVVMSENDAADGIIQLAYQTPNARQKEQLTTIVEYPDIIVHPQRQHRGKNIAMLKAQYASETTTTHEIQPTDEVLMQDDADKIPKLLPTSFANDIAALKKQAFSHACQKKTPQPFSETKRKRKRAVKVIGSGRPTNDQTMVRIANDRDDDQDQVLNAKQLFLLSSTGEIRKKTTIYTKNPEDIKCFAIKHYNSLSLIAEQRKNALEDIKKQRTLLEQLAYMETCLLPLVRDNGTF
jgi:hypothetical protein